MSAIDAEIEALDEVIHLEKQKLDLLRSARHAALSGGGSTASVEPAKALPSSQKALSKASSKAKGSVEAEDNKPQISTRITPHGPVNQLLEIHVRSLNPATPPIVR